MCSLTTYTSLWVLQNMAHILDPQFQNLAYVQHSMGLLELFCMTLVKWDMRQCTS